MDFSDLAAMTEAKKVEIIKPNGEKTGIFLYLLGQDSKKYKEFERELTLVQLKELANKDDNKKVSLDPDELFQRLEKREKMAFDQALICVDGWEGVHEDGKEVKFSQEKLKEYLSMDGMGWVIEFINNYVMNRVNFIKRS